ncbi:MAG: septum formation family protein [Trebonia sp.]
MADSVAEMPGQPGEAEDDADDGESADAGEAVGAGEPDVADEFAESDEEESAGSDEDSETDGDGEEYEASEDDEDAGDAGDAGPRRARRWPRVLLALGFVILAAAVVGGAIVIVSSITHGFKKPVKVTYKTSAVFSLKTGNCFDPQGQQSYTLIPCDSPHQAEVFATFALTGSKWPGTTAVQSQAGAGCASRLTGYVNPQLAISLSSTYVYPDSVAWQAGTRTVICEVRATNGELNGSVRGASASG